MTMRTTSRTVTFLRPFCLRGLGEMQPAGTYSVETDEEVLNTLRFSAFRRISTTIRVQVRPGVTQVVPIDPDELDQASARDDTATKAPSESAARQAHRADKKALFQRHEVESA